TPVWNTSCTTAADPPPAYGRPQCALTDGSVPAWSPDMAGHVVRDVKVSVSAGKNTVVIPLDRAGYDKLANEGSALVSFETPNDEVQAFDVPLRATSQDGSVGGSVPAQLALTLGPAASFGAFTPGLAHDYSP